MYTKLSSILIVLALASVSASASAAPITRGLSVCSDDQIKRIFDGYRQAAEICLIQGRSIYCTADGRWQCCRDDRSGCSGSVSIPPASRVGATVIQPNGANAIPPASAPIKPPAPGGKTPGGVLPN